MKTKDELMQNHIIPAIDAFESIKVLPLDILKKQAKLHPLEEFKEFKKGMIITFRDTVLWYAERGWTRPILFMLAFVQYGSVVGYTKFRLSEFYHSKKDISGKYHHPSGNAVKFYHSFTNYRDFAKAITDKSVVIKNVDKFEAFEIYTHNVYSDKVLEIDFI